MGIERSESRHRSEARYHDDSPMRESGGGGIDVLEEDDIGKLRELSKHRNKDRKKSRKEEKEHKSRDRDRSKTNDDLRERDKEAKDFEKERISSRGKWKEDREEHEKGRSTDKVREKDIDRDKHREKERDKDRDRKDRGEDRDFERYREIQRDTDQGRDERGKEKVRERDKEKTKNRDRLKDRDRAKEEERHRDREKDRDSYEREKRKEKTREKEKEVDQDKEKSRDRDKASRKNRDDAPDQSKDELKEDKSEADSEDSEGAEVGKHEKISHSEEDGLFDQEKDVERTSDGQHIEEIQERILKVKEERLKKKSEGVSEILAWVNRSRRIEEKMNTEKEKAMWRSKILEEQDNVGEDSDNETEVPQTANALAGIKVLHGLDKVIEGGSVVLTLKDQEILANGDINEDVDMLENVELGEQKRRDDAYKAAKKKTGIYDDKFNDEPGAERKILPQYDDPAAEEGMTLDASGSFTGEAEKKLQELRMRLQGAKVNSQVEDLNSSVKIASDYYSHEEMLQFKKPKKKKSLRKREKLDIDALEAEAISTGLGVGDLGSRNDARRQAAKEEQEKSEAEKRKNAYDAAYAKAQEASRALQMAQANTIQAEDDTPVFADDAEDLQKSLERARKLALKKQKGETAAGPEAIARLASNTNRSEPADSQNPASGESLENKVVFTEMEEFVWGLQLDEEVLKGSNEDVFMDEDVAPKPLEGEAKDEAGGWTEVRDSDGDEQMKDEDKEEIVPDDTIHEAPVGKGLSQALKLLKERGALKETVEWGGRNMDKKKSKLVGIYDDEGAKEIRIERTDEYGRILTPKEAFRLLSHKFHGKGPGKMKQEKRMKQYLDELKLKQMKNSDTPSESVERMRETQARLGTPYLVLSGHVKPGQDSDPRSGFATVEKDLPGGLTPMLGDKKVEHFLGIKRKAEPGNSGAPKKPRT
ncbi:ESCRT II complex subunit Dot2 [Ancistrocladus abbreviatus]